MPTQLTLQERAILETLLRSKTSPTDALAKINKSRVNKGIAETTLSTISRFFSGVTHKRGRSERRGRPSSLTKSDISTLDKARMKLLKQADGRRPVTYNDIQEEAGFQGSCSSRTVQDALRGIGVRMRAPRRKVFLTAEDAKRRLKVAKAWVKRPAQFWSTGIHAYVDNKSFPLPLTPAQKAKLQRSVVTGHLRKASEGLSPCCTKPKERHSFLGIPSATITAAVAKDRVIVWDVVKSQWNGAAAAKMYTGPLSFALKKAWAPKRRYTIVEDGDRKGNQSSKGLAAKQKAKIRAMTLPPRTPSWMPLDYAIWQEIDKRMNGSAPSMVETKAEFLARLEKTARGLPKAFIRKVLARMKGNIKAVIDAGGYHAKND